MHERRNFHNKTGNLTNTETVSQHKIDTDKKVNKHRDTTDFTKETQQDKTQRRN